MLTRQATTFACVHLKFIDSSFFTTTQNHYSIRFKALCARTAEANVHFLNTYISVDMHQAAHSCNECDKIVIKYHNILRKMDINIVDYL